MAYPGTPPVVLRDKQTLEIQKRNRGGRDRSRCLGKADYVIVYPLQRLLQVSEAAKSGLAVAPPEEVLQAQQR